MEILGIGFPELVLILIIVLLVMGPEDLQRTARLLGRGLRRVRRSGVWQALLQIQQELRWFFIHLEHEAGLEETRRHIEEVLLESDQLPPSVDEGLQNDAPADEGFSHLSSPTSGEDEK